LYNLAFLCLIITGSNFALLLGFTKRANRSANRFLALALVAMVLWMLRISGIDIWLLQFSLALGPLIYFYVLKITQPEYQFRRKDLLHFSSLLVGYWMPGWLILISVMTYLYLSHRLIQEFYKRLRPVLMDRPRFAFRWLDRVLLLLGLLCALALFNDTFWLTIAFILIGMAAYAMLKPDSGVQQIMPITDRSDAREKSRRLKEAVAANRLYEDAELTLTTLAVKLNIHPHDLSRIINIGLEKNFSDFINEFRVREVARKMQDPAYNRLTLLGIAYESGFNSERTFHRVFKEMTGKTPLEYKNSLRKELPNDNLATGPRIRPVILRSGSPPNWAPGKLNRNYMFRNYLKVAWRNIKRNKTFSFINITGLAAGTLCCLYILLYVQDQYSYDKHHQDAGDLYRITTTIQLSGSMRNIAAVSPPVAPAVKRGFPEVVQFARVFSADLAGDSRNMVKYQDRSFDENGFAFVDSTFFEVFSYHFVYGRSPSVLAEPFSVVLQQPLAAKLFGNQDPVGKVITIDNNYGKHDYKVTGVVDESLGKTHIRVNIFVTMRSGGFGRFILNNKQWAGENTALSYLRLRPGSNAAALERKLPGLLNKYGAGQLRSMRMTKTLHLQPVISIHTMPGYDYELSKPASPELLGILTGIAIMIQLVACINFMNLSTARASRRAKEVGVRKVAGAVRGDLVKQFLGESFLLTLIGVLLAVPLLYLAMPYLNQVTQSDIKPSFLGHSAIWLILIAIVAVTGAVAGSYPAFYLSAFDAIKVMKGNFTSPVSASGIRRSLVLFQFFLSIVLISSITIIYSQLNYIKDKDLGFDQNQKLIFNFYTGDGRAKMATLAADLRQLAGVKYASLGDNYLCHNNGGDLPVYPAGGNALTAVATGNMGADDQFARANSIKIIAGRDFNVHDTLMTLINETLCKRLGLKAEDAPGARLFSKRADGSVIHFDIAGVMKDFNYGSLHEEVGPFMIFHNDNAGNYFSYMTVSVSSKNYRSLLAEMETIWGRDLPGVPFEYMFLDQEVQKQYQAELNLSRIINSFTIMAILITCLGLFGLAAFSAEQRRKEISIRKILGARATAIAYLLSKEFVWLVATAFLPAASLAWWVMHKWLEGFAYKVSVSWWMFATAGVLSFGIALLTVSFQAIKAALANPADSLRSE